MALFYQPDLNDIHLTQEESRHAVKVLRLREGDTIELADGQGHICQAVITKADERETGFRITEKKLIPRRRYSIHLAIAPTKNIDRMEWMVEKCTEIGIEKITFVQCKTSERPSVQMDRLMKITVSAMKQSRQVWLPELADMVPFKEFLPTLSEDQRFIAFVDQTNPNHISGEVKPGRNCVLLVGPEGDFTPEELSLAIQNGFLKVSLGPNRLRTETAGVYGVVAIATVNHTA